jgi:hypothetical protein
MKAYGKAAYEARNAVETVLIVYYIHTATVYIQGGHGILTPSGKM